MTIVKKYKKYRQISRDLNDKIFETCLDRDILLKSARLIGIARGDILILDSEYETDILIDFALNDYKVKKQNTVVEIYRDKVGWENEVEKEILDAFISSYTSLFKITSISKAENSLLLNDVFNKKNNNIKIIDIASSKSAIPGILLFLRIIQFEDFNMASGISFAFTGDLEKYLLKKYKTLSRHVKSDDDSIKRFVSFYKLSKTDGIEVRYE